MSLEEAWDALQTVLPTGWYVGQPSYHLERDEWQQYAFRSERARRPASRPPRRTTVPARGSAMRPVTLECPATPPVFCLGPSPGNEAAVQIRIAKSALPIERMCFTIRFEGDLLDAGEQVSIGFSPDPFALGFGFENIGTEPISERTACIVAGLHDDLLAMVAVKKPMVFVYMNHGSATVADLEVFLLPL